jgi:hypothetical protein
VMSFVAERKVTRWVRAAQSAAAQPTTART